MEHQQISHHYTGRNYNDLVDQLLACASACEKCAAACLDEQDVTAMAHCIKLDRDCADTCLLAAKLLLRDSGFARDFIAVCATICSHCAEECSKHNMEHCKQCAEACAACAAACRALNENSL